MGGVIKLFKMKENNQKFVPAQTTGLVYALDSGKKMNNKSTNSIKMQMRLYVSSA